MKNKWVHCYLISHFVVLLALLGLVFIAIPTSDDYMFANASHSSIIVAAKGMFNGWGGRYVQAIVSVLWYKAAFWANFSYSTGLLLFIVLFFIGIYCLLKQLLSSIFTNAKVILISGLVLAGILRGLPTLDESIYWNIGGITYLLPMAVFLMTVSLIIYAYKSNKDLRYQPIIMISILFTGGINEAFTIYNIIIVLALYIFMRYSSKIRYAYSLSFFTAIIALTLVFVSKGNDVRMTHYPESGQIVPSLIYGTIFGTMSIFQTIADPYIWGSILLFCPLWKMVHDNSMVFYSSSVFKYLAVGVILLALYAVPGIHYYATGNKPVVRFMVIWYIVFYFGAILLSVVFSEWLMSFYKLLEGVVKRVVPSRIDFQSLLIIIVFAGFLLINNFPKVVYDYTVNIPGFIEEAKQFELDVKKLQNSDVSPKVLVVDEFKYRPILLKAPTDVDYGMAEYYDFDKVVIRKNKK